MKKFRPGYHHDDKAFCMVCGDWAVVQRSFGGMEGEYSCDQESCVQQLLIFRELRGQPDAAEEAEVARRIIKKKGRNGIKYEHNRM